MIKYALPALFLALLPFQAYADIAVFADPQYYPSLIGLGLLFLVLEFVLPTKGLLGIAGIAMFVAGTYSLADYPKEEWRLSWPAIISLDILVIGTAVLVAWLTYKGYTAKHENITDGLINKEAKVTEWNSERKTVEVNGTIWKAISTHLLNVGDKVTITHHENLTLHVIPKGENK